MIEHNKTTCTIINILTIITHVERTQNNWAQYNTVDNQTHKSGKDTAPDNDGNSSSYPENINNVYKG